MAEQAAGKSQKRKGWKKAVVGVLFGLLAVIVLLIAYVILSPVPAAQFMRATFASSTQTQLDGWAEMVQGVTIIKDASYPSAQKDNTADIYLPEKSAGLFPVILWIHGGAFVGGDKQDIRYYAMNLAAEGYAVISMNYRRAPEAHYPSPIVQMGEAYLWLLDVAGEYNLDMTRFAVAGDSAGAQMAYQFAAIQTSTEYASLVGIPAVVQPSTLKATLLYCGPYDLVRLANNASGLPGFLLGKAAQAYFGAKDWKTNAAPTASMLFHLSEALPPTFITDGNSGSFERDNKELAAALTELGVPVESYFIDPAEEVCGHEYQFTMNTPAGREAYDRTVTFLEHYFPAQ